MTLYHGTAAKSWFEIPDEPDGYAWFGTTLETGRYFTDWNYDKDDSGPRRALEFILTGSPRLARFDDREAMDLFVARFIMQIGGPGWSRKDLIYEASGNYETRDVVHEVCRQGFDGWIIPGNYEGGSGGDDIVLCQPSAWVRLVGVEWVDPRPRGRQWA
jgi:hypothetical protein